MSGETAVPKTGVFWDVDNFPIPDDLDLQSTYMNIQSAVAKEGHSDYLDMKLFGEESNLLEFRKLPRLVGIPKVAGFLVVPKRLNEKYHLELIFKIYSWASDNPPPSTLLVISKVITEEMLFTALDCLLSRGYKVLVPHPGVDLPSFPARSVWFWNILSRGGRPIVHRGTKRKRSEDTVLKSLFQAMSVETAPRTGLLLDVYDFPLPGPRLPPVILDRNIQSGLEKKGFLIETVQYLIYPSNTDPMPEDMVNDYMAFGMKFLPEELCESSGGGQPTQVHDRENRADWMLHDIALWMLDSPSSTPHNLVIVSNTFAEEWYTSFLEAFRARGHRVLLVHDHNKVKQAESEDTETLQWLWETILATPESPICAICGRDDHLK